MEKGLEHFNELRRLADSEEPEVIRNYYLGIGDEFEFEVEEELTFEEDEGEPFTELIQTIHVYLDGEEVYEFERTYQGFNSVDGDDWEVEEIDNTIDTDVASIFEACGVELDTPNVPKADDEDFEEDEE
jgi:hypothetical protein